MWRIAEYHKAAVKYGLMFDSAVNQALRTAGEKAVFEAKTTDAFKRRSTKSVKDSNSYKPFTRGKTKGIRLTNTRKRALWLEKGTKPHLIKARRRRYLRFSSGGKVFFRRSVFHPGTRATKFFSSAAQEGLKALRADLVRRATAIGRRNL